MGFSRQEYWSEVSLPSPTPTPTPVSKAAFPMILHNRWGIQRERLATHLLSGQRNQDICPHHHHPLENTVFSKATFPLTPVPAFHSNPLKWTGWELSSLHYRWGNQAQRAELICSPVTHRITQLRSSNCSFIILSTQHEILSGESFTLNTFISCIPALPAYLLSNYCRQIEKKVPSPIDY